MRSIRRNTELGLIVLGTLVTVGAYLLASLARDATIPANIGPFLGIVLGLQLAAHVAIRRFAPYADGTLVPIAGLLNGLGYVFIVRLDEAKADPDGLAGLQSGWIAVGIGAFIATIVVVRRVRDLERYRWTIGLLGLALLMLPLVPGVGREYFGARIWVKVGPVNFQPGEFAKILLALFFASYLVEKRELLAVSSRRLGPIPLPDLKHLGPVLLAWGVSLVVMVSQKDLGSSLLFFALFVALLWVATERATYLVVGVLLFAGGAAFAHTQFEHVQQRVDIWLDPWQDPKGDGFQIVEAQFAFAAGGVTGTGLNLGSPGRIPLAETDFIFAAIGEELGLLGASAVLMAYLLLVGAGLRIAMRSEIAFERLLATGLTVLIGVQSFIIMAGVMRVLPLTGITLPFVSYGGSSLIANYVLLGLLVRISDDSARRAAERAPGREAVLA
jgi:cell division protein FtsW (lipid II flippase)